MLSCHRSVIIRSLGLLGLVVLMILAADSVWALSDNYLVVKDVTGNVGVFPYLSPVPEQRNIIANAFNFQMSLFGSISGAGGNAIKSLYYLAITAALIGGLLTIFNPKYRKMPIMASWVLLVIITVFAPYGSKLLFYPITPSGGLTRGLTSTAEPSGDCSQFPKTCGFAPQLAAIHVASVVQLVLSDLFNSMQWKTLIEQTISKASMANNPKMVASPEWPDKIKNYANDCGGFGWDDLMAYRHGQAAAEDDATVPTTLGKEWARISAPYGPKPAQPWYSIYPPDAINLYDESTYPSDDGRGGDRVTNWDKPTAASSYEAGITALFQAITGKQTTVKMNATEPGSIKVTDALTILDRDWHFFDPEICSGGILGAFQKCRINTGLFFVWPGSSASQAADKSALAYRKCYYGSTRGVQISGLCSGNQTPDSQRTAMQTVMATPLTEDDGITRWNAFRNAVTQSALADMPVGVIHYQMGNPLARGAATALPTESVRSCMKEGNRLIDEGVNWSIGATGQAKQLEPLRQLLINKREIPVVTSTDDQNNKTLSLDGKIGTQIYDKNGACNGNAAQGGVGRGGGCVYPDDAPMANEIINAYDIAQHSKASELGHELTPEEQYDVLLKLVIDSMAGSTETFRKNMAMTDEQKAAEAKASSDSTAVDQVGIGFLSSVGGFGAIVFGKLVANVASWLTGPLSTAIVYFISLLVDMSLLLLIVLTPILFLVGLVVPSMAMGVLTISIMGAFILKAVPITLLVLNNIGGLVYAMIGAGGGSSSDTMQSLMILAMAGLYANLVGMTFFLIFKLGDPATILGRMTALDGAGKQVAERGMAAFAAVAGAAALAGSGAIFGAAGGMKARAIANRLGVPTAGADKVLSTIEAVKDGAGGLNEQTSKGGTGPVDPESDSADQVRRAINSGAYGDGWTPEDVQGLLDNPDGYTRADGKQFAIGKDGNVWTVNPMGGGAGPDVGDTGLSGGSVVPRISGGGGSGSGGAGATITRQTSATEQANIDGKPTDAVTGTDPTKTPQLGEDGKPVTQIPADATAGGTAATVAGGGGGGAPLRVSVVDGTLTSVGKVGSADRVAAIEEEKAAQRTADENARYKTAAESAEFSEDARPQAQAIADELKNATTPEERAAAKEKFAALAASEGKTVSMLTRNLNDQIAEDMAVRVSEINRKIEAPGISQADKKSLEAQRDAMIKLSNETDTAGITATEMYKRLGTIEQMEQARDMRVRADNAPGIWQSAYSGVWGAMGGTGGALARIPIIGPAISESLNEYYQAPERARSWNAVGGKAVHDRLNDAAKRQGFFNKEIAPLAAGTQYESMVATGAFQGQISLAQQTARESVAKSRSQFEAMVDNRRAQVMPLLEKQLGDDKAFQGSLTGLKAEERSQRISTELNNRFTNIVEVGNYGSVTEYRKSAAMPELKSKLENDKAFQASIADLKGDARTNRISAELDRRYEIEVPNSNFDLVMSDRELRGLGRIEAHDRIASVRGEAAAMQGVSGRGTRAYEVDESGNFKLDSSGAKIAALDSNMMLRTVDGKVGSAPVKYKVEEVDFMLTPQAMGKVRGDLAMKKIAGNVDDMLITHYGLVEKQYLRGNAEWDQTRNMTTNAAAAAAFVRKDVGAEYMIAGHLKMVEGKIGHKDREGQYKKLVEFRGDENRIKADFIQKQIVALGGIDNVLKDAKFDASAYNGRPLKDLQYAQRAALDKYATSRSKDLLKLEAIFDEAASNGTKKYEEKALVAKFNLKNQDAAIYGKVQGAFANSMNALDGFNVQAMSDKLVRRNGVSEKLAAAPKAWFDLLGKAGVKLDQMSQFFEATARGMKNNPDDPDEKGVVAGDNVISQTIDEKGDVDKGIEGYTRAYHAFSQKRKDAVLKEIRRVNEDVADALKDKIRYDSELDAWVYSDVKVKESGKTERDGEEI